MSPRRIVVDGYSLMWLHRRRYERNRTIDRVLVLPTKGNRNSSALVTFDSGELCTLTSPPISNFSNVDYPGILIGTASNGRTHVVNLNRPKVIAFIVERCLADGWCPGETRFEIASGFAHFANARWPLGW